MGYDRVILCLNTLVNSSKQGASVDKLDEEQVKKRMNLYATPFDVEKYIREGVISRATPSSKNRFIINCHPHEVPEEINARANAVEIKKLPDGSSKPIYTLDLSVQKN